VVAAVQVTAPGGSGGGVTPPKAPSENEAARFLSQAAVGITRAQIARVQAIGYSAWIDEQMTMAGSGTRWDWLKAKGYDAAANIFTQNGFDNVVWAKLISSQDTLRQRVTQAWSEIIVVGIDGLVGAGWQPFSAAAFLDLLEATVSVISARCWKCVYQRRDGAVSDFPW
jgi:hypothetical protein